MLVCDDCGAEYDPDRDECPDCGSLDAELVDVGGGPGRFWGYRGLRAVLAVRQVTPAVGIQAGRILRRWYRAKGLTKKVSVPRVEQATGRVRIRHATVRKRLFLHNRGFAIVSDGPAFASQLARYLAEAESDEHGIVGGKRWCSGGDDDFHPGRGEGGAERLGRCVVGDEYVDEVQRAQDHGFLVVELAVVGGDDNAVGEAGEHAPDLDLGGVEVGDPAVDGQPTAAEDQQVEVNLWRFLRGAGIDQGQFGGQEATEHDHPTSALAYRDRGVQGVGDHGEVAAMG
jgi:hypothetical protein